MRRREVLKSAALAIAAWPCGQAGATEPKRRIGILMGVPLNDPEGAARIQAIRKHLADLGWTDRNTQFEIRSSNGEAAARVRLARELVDLKPDVILAASTPDTDALLRLTRTIPIVFATAADPLGSGFVQSLARPGGNVTGFTNSQDSLGGKWLELLKQVAPRVVRAGVLFNPWTTANSGLLYMPHLTAAGISLGVRIETRPVKDLREIEASIRTLAESADTGLILLPDSFTVGHRKEIVALAARHRIPAIYPFRYFVDVGGLISYGVDLEEPAVRIAGYVDLILRGASPAELPVQSPRKYQLLVNVKAAKALDLVIPPVLLARADQLVE